MKTSQPEKMEKGMGVRSCMLCPYVYMCVWGRFGVLEIKGGSEDGY